MCFSRRSFWREDATEGTREDPDRERFDREHEAGRPQPIVDRERAEHDAEESRERIPVGAES